MNKKGFVFVETIVVTVVLTVALIIIFSTFNSVLSNEKKRMAFEDTGYMYNTFYLNDFLSTLNIKNYINNYFNGTNPVIIKQLSCNDVLLYKNNEDINSKGVFCEKLINNYNLLGINKVYITKYDISDIKDCINNSCSDTNIKRNLENFDISFINYLKTLNPNSAFNDYYRLIVEYKEVELDYTNFMKKNASEPYCQTGYVLSGDNCIKDITKYYYDNIAFDPINNTNPGGGPAVPTPTPGPTDPDSYTLTYSGVSSSMCSPKTVGIGEKWGTLCTPTKTGNEFDGWYTGQNGTGTEITQNTTATGNIIVYPKWELSTYTLTFNSDGGSNCSSIDAQYNTSWGTLCTPTKKGCNSLLSNTPYSCSYKNDYYYKFDGWYTGQNGTGSKVQSSTKARENTTVYANWKKIKILVDIRAEHEISDGSNCDKYLGLDNVYSDGVYYIERFINEPLFIEYDGCNWDYTYIGSNRKNRVTCNNGTRFYHWSVYNNSDEYFIPSDFDVPAYNMTFWGVYDIVDESADNSKTYGTCKA